MAQPYRLTQLTTKTGVATATPAQKPDGEAALKAAIEAFAEPSAYADNGYFDAGYEGPPKRMFLYLKHAGGEFTFHAEVQGSVVVSGPGVGGPVSGEDRAMLQRKLRVAIKETPESNQSLMLGHMLYLLEHPTYETGFGSSSVAADTFSER